MNVIHGGDWNPGQFRSNTYLCMTPKELGGFSAPVKRSHLEGRTQVGQRGSLRAVEDWVMAGTFFYAFVVCLCVLRCKLKGKAVKTLHKAMNSVYIW